MTRSRPPTQAADISNMSGWDPSHRVSREKVPDDSCITFVPWPHMSDSVSSALCGPGSPRADLPRGEDELSI